MPLIWDHIPLFEGTRRVLRVLTIIDLAIHFGTGGGHDAGHGFAKEIADEVIPAFRALAVANTVMTPVGGRNVLKPFRKSMIHAMSLNSGRSVGCVFRGKSSMSLGTMKAISSVSVECRAKHLFVWIALRSSPGEMHGQQLRWALSESSP